MTDMRIVIPSRGRANECRHALNLFPGATVVCHDYEYEQYKAALPKGTELHQHDLEGGIAPIRQWVLDTFDEEAILFVDDDVRYLRVVAGHRTAARIIKDPAAIAQVVQNAADIAATIGAPVFGFAQTGGDVRKYKPTDPIRLATWVGAVLGIVGRNIRYDTTLRMRADIDYCLQALMEERFVYMDTRFSFVHHKMFAHKGGNAHMRSRERSEREINQLKQRWGDWISIRPTKTQVRIVLNVKRRQSGLR